MIRRLAAAALISLLALAGPAASQIPFQDEEVTIVDGLVVRAFGGPAWWKISDGDTTIHVMASPGALPKDLEWSKQGLERRLTGANQLIIADPELRIGLGAVVSVPKALFGVLRLDNEADRLERTLPADVRARFVSAREALGKPASRYGAHSAGMAGMMLLGDAYDRWVPAAPQSARGQNGKNAGEVAADLARTRRVPVSHPTGLPVGVMNDLLADLQRPGVPCLVQTLDEYDKGQDRARAQSARAGGTSRAALDAWAEGDVGPLAAFLGRHDPDRIAEARINIEEMRLHLRAPNVCVRSMTRLQRLGDQISANTVQALERSLRRPGKAVAIVPVGELLKQGGVLEQMRAKGYTITLPNQE